MKSLTLDPKLDQRLSEAERRFAEAQARMTDIGVYTVLNLSASDQLFLYNVDPSQLIPGNFLFL